jgi:hypothetical protein
LNSKIKNRDLKSLGNVCVYPKEKQCADCRNSEALPNRDEKKQQKKEALMTRKLLCACSKTKLKSEAEVFPRFGKTARFKGKALSPFVSVIGKYDPSFVKEGSTLKYRKEAER